MSIWQQKPWPSVQKRQGAITPLWKRRTPANGPTLFYRCQRSRLQDLPEQGAPKNKSWFFFFFARGNKYHWDLKQNKNTIEAGREIGSRMTSSLKSYLNSRLTIKTKTPSQIKWKQGRWFHLRVRNGCSWDIFTNNVSQDVNNLPSMLVFMTLTDILHIYSENQSSPIPSINNPQKIFCLHGQGAIPFPKIDKSSSCMCSAAPPLP